MKATCINQLELAVRWGISHRTVERWRRTGEGPKFLKVGGRVVCRLSDVEEYEQAMIRSSTSDPAPLSKPASEITSGRTHQPRGERARLSHDCSRKPYSTFRH